MACLVLGRRDCVGGDAISLHCCHGVPAYFRVADGRCKMCGRTARTLGWDVICGVMIRVSVVRVSSRPILCYSFWFYTTVLTHILYKTQ